MLQAKIRGWNNQAISAAATSLGYSSMMGSAVLPKGPIQLVDFAMQQWFNQFSQKLQSSPLKEMGITNRIRTGILLRLNQVKPYQKTWPEAMALGIQPAYLPQTLSQIHKISDQIWYRAGDTSLDYNWYTKRGLLSSLYISTELFMIQDNSQNFKQTEEYLDRRLQDILSVGQGLVNGKNFGSAIFTGLLSLGQSFLLPIKQTKDVSKLISQIRNSEIFNKGEDKNTKSN